MRIAAFLRLALQFPSAAGDRRLLACALLALSCLAAPSAEAKDEGCTVEALRASVRARQSQGEQLTHLERRSWWRRCPLPVRRTVFSGLAGGSASPPASSSSAARVRSALPVLGNAPELRGLGQWFNSAPLTLASLKGKVVLVNFWTFACINCIHTLSAVQGYWEKYGSDRPFIVLGVHTPELTFEKSAQNLQNAIAERGLTYPIVQDNDYATWNAYGNRYWPAFYLIDAAGAIRYQHFGEGAYDAMDAAIRDLLAETGQ